jgi:UDP-GlcNAc:undecaprenyl-phosphate GlcNAc-1-phosphate transferase
MSFPFNLYLLSFASAFVAAWVSLPAWRRWCDKTGLVDDPGHRKIHDQPIALAGGFTVLTALALALLGGILAVWVSASFAASSMPDPVAETSGLGRGWLDADTADLLQYGLRRRAAQLAAILLGAVAMFFLGWLDDKHELKPAAKFSGQLLIAALVAASGVRITLFVPSMVFSYAVTLLWILTVTNAFNFMDNMNGLCSGLGAICAWQFAVSAALHGQYLVAAFALMICGALLGFLPYNFPKATAFLGDAGSHLAGFLLAVLAILPHFYSREHQNRWAVLSPLLILAVPLADLVWVVILRWRSGQPFYVGDTNHLSHRLVRRGLSRTRAVAVIWLIAAALGSVAFL